MQKRILKRSKLPYYLRGYWYSVFPTKKTLSSQLRNLASQLSPTQLALAEERARYYCASLVGLPFSKTHVIGDLRHPKSPKAYYFDTYEYARFCAATLPIDFLLGDVTAIPSIPSLVKSRPITSDNKNSVLLNMDKARHFVWVRDKKRWEEKQDRLIGMGAIYQQHRYAFFDRYFGHPLCELGDVGKNGIGRPEWHRPKKTIPQHLDYKFILSLQGNDVATNLKWIMSSHSIAVMPRPTIETWFMEGRLRGGEHYIEIRADYADLEEQLHYYLAHPAEANTIIENANTYCAQFFNPLLEDFCSLRVLERFYQR